MSLPGNWTPEAFPVNTRSKLLGRGAGQAKTSVLNPGQTGNRKQRFRSVATDYRPERNGAALALKPGDVFNPFNLFDGAVIASSIFRNPDLSPSAKLVFARLTQFAGAHGNST